MEQDVGELGLEGVAVLDRAEVAAGAAPVGDRAGHPADHLADRALARRRVELATEVLLADDVGGVLRPGRGELDSGLLESDVVAVADPRVADLPVDGVPYLGARLREAALDGERVAGLDGVGFGGVGLRGGFHFSAFLSPAFAWLARLSRVRKTAARTQEPPTCPGRNAPFRSGLPGRAFSPSLLPLILARDQPGSGVPGAVSASPSGRPPMRLKKLVRARVPSVPGPKRWRARSYFSSWLPT